MYLGLMLSTSLTAQGQPFPDMANWHVERIPLADQVGSSSGKSIVKDSRGYLWIGTNNGISRYDGYTFTTYAFIAGDSTTLNHSRTDYLFIDHQDVLWVGTRVGLNRYRPECDCFKQYHPGPGTSDTIPNGPVNWIAEDNNKALWVVTQHGGLYRYDREKDNFQRFLYRTEDAIDLSSFALRVVMGDRDGQLWVGTGEPFTPTDTGNGLIRFDPVSGEARHYRHRPNDVHSLVDNRIGALMQDRRGRIWVGTCDNGVHLYDPEEDHFIRMSVLDQPPSEIYSVQAGIGAWSSCPLVRILHEDRQGGIWVGTYNGGLQRFDLEKGTVRLFQHDPQDPASLGSNQVWSFLEDEQGRFWVGSLEQGEVVKIDPFQKKFQVSFPDENVFGIYVPPSKPEVMWVSIRDKGVYRIDKKNKTRRFYQKSENRPQGPASNVIWSFFEDRDQDLWLATDEGLSLYDRITDQFTHYPITVEGEQGVQSVPIMVIHQDRYGGFWLGSWAHSAFRFDKATGDYQQIALPNELDTYSQTVYAIHEDTKNRLWLGSWMDGIFLIDRKSGQVTKFLDGIGARQFHEDEAGTLWLATSANGLVRFSPEKGILQQFTTEIGLVSNTILTIAEDEDHHLWLGTGAGLTRFDPEDHTFLVFDRSDGIPSNAFSEFSRTQAPDGTIYFGTNEGLVHFQPGQIMANPVAPDVQVSDIKIFDRSYRELELDSGDDTALTLPAGITLSHAQNELTFEYVGLHYTIPEQNQYRHRLLPYEEEWIEAQDQRSARYTNLSPGSYRFEVIASNSDGRWATEPASIDIQILPPWWATWWAYVLYGLSAFSLLYGIYRFQKRRWALQASLQREQEESLRLRELDEFKSRLYANITHEFRTPLTVIQGLSDQILDNPRWKISEKIQLIKRNSRKLLELINQLLDLSKLEAGRLQPDYIQGDVVPYFNYLIESFQSLAFSHKITISFNPQVDELIMDYDPEKYQQIISNLLANAVKFTPEYGKVTVRLQATPDPRNAEWLEVQVRDTGVGIPEEKLPYIFDRFYQVDNSTVRRAEGSGLGLALVKELLELMGGDIQVESQVNKGTTFLFRLPVRHSALTSSAPNIQQPPGEVRSPVAIPRTGTNGNEEAPLVLVVEDNQDVIYYLRGCLEDQYQLEEARNGREGVDKAREIIPDLIISDVMMPGMNGFELCKTLKTDERTDHIPIVLLTAKATQADKVEGLSRGADAYLAKPFQKEELLVRLEQLLELRRKLQQKYQGNDYSEEEAEDPFLQKVKTIILSRVDDAELSVLQLSREVGMSRVQLHRKLKALADVSASELIRNLRLQKARELLKNTDLNISEIAYEVGFKDPSHFSRTFSQQFGATPSEMRG